MIHFLDNGVAPRTVTGPSAPPSSTGTGPSVPLSIPSAKLKKETVLKMLPDIKVY